MNTSRNQINLAVLSTLTPLQTALFRLFFSAKGVNFTEEKIKTLLTTRIPAEKLEESIAAIPAELLALESLGIITRKANADLSAGIIWLMEPYNTADLPTEQQIMKDGKITTALTANGETLPYVGMEVLYLNHPLSPEYIAGEFIGRGTIKNYHPNEIGMVYCVIDKAQSADEIAANKKVTKCAKRLSNLYFVGNELPTVGVNGCTVKKNAGYEAVLVNVIPDLAKGATILAFNNRWSEKAKHMNQIIESVSAALPGVLVHKIDTDWQVADCIKYQVRKSPTLIAVKDGVEVGRLDGFPEGDKYNEAVYELFKTTIEVEAPKQTVPAKKENVKKEKGGKKK